MIPRFADLAGWLEWQEGLHPSTIDLGLTRITQVADTLFGQSPHWPFTITVAGTNGKGSCVTALSTLLTACGKRVGSFTSPHLHRYNERIRVNGIEITDEELCAAFSAIDEARGDVSLTYFEFNALAALWFFKQQGVDIQVLEVGLGGRLDAVNILDADIAVITTIALDHTDWLGNTREQIGAEKAGILRQHSTCIYGERVMPNSIQSVIAERGCDCRQIGVDFDFTVTEKSWTWQGRTANGNPVSLTTVVPALPLPSVACALQVLCEMDLWQPEIIAFRVPNLSLAGRFEHQLIHGKRVIFDVAHNAAGAEFLAEQLRVSLYQPVDILFAAMADKDITSMVFALKPTVAHWYLLALENNPRAATVDQLASVLEQQGVAMTDVSRCSDLASGLSAAIHTNTHQALLVAGSFFTVAAVKEALLHV